MKALSSENLLVALLQLSESLSWLTNISDMSKIHLTIPWLLEIQIIIPCLPLCAVHKFYSVCLSSLHFSSYKSDFNINRLKLLGKCVLTDPLLFPGKSSCMEQTKLR